MDRNSFIRERLQQDVRLYRGFTIGVVIIAAACVIMGVIALYQSKVSGGITLLAMGVAFALDIAPNRSKMRDRLVALDEIGDDFTDIDGRDDLSPQTRALLDSSMLPIKDYRGQFIAYMVLGITLLAGAVVIFGVALGEAGLLPFGVLLVGGAIILFRLAATAAHNRKIAQQLSDLEEAETIRI